MPHSVPVHFLNYSRYSDSLLNSKPKHRLVEGRLSLHQWKTCTFSTLVLEIVYFLTGFWKETFLERFLSGLEQKCTLYLHPQTILLNTAHSTRRNTTQPFCYTSLSSAQLQTQREEKNKSTFSQIILILNARMTSVNVYCAQVCDPRLAQT